MPVQLTVSGEDMVIGLHVLNPAEVVTCLDQDQKSMMHLMAEKSVKENQQRPLYVTTMHAPLIVNGGHIVSGLHAPNPAEAVKSFAQDQKSIKHLMEGKTAKER